MKTARRLEELSTPPRPRAVALGNFDGIHLGHRRILTCLVDHARRHGLVSLLLTFSPHPEEVLGRGRVLMIQPLSRRLEAASDLKLDEVLVMPFNAAFSSLPPSRFIERVLVKSLAARAVFVGTNFRFGRNRAGNIKTLQEYGSRTGLFEVCIVPPVVKFGRVVSSSLIRRMLLEGKVHRAASLLGRPYEVRGTVVRGRSVGRRLGFPTANLRTENEILPPGIFVSRAVIGGRAYPSLAYIGRRPTFGPGSLQVEAYLLRFRGALYGRKMTLQLLTKLRPDRKFPDAATLTRQIELDARRAREHFRRASPSRPRH